MTNALPEAEGGVWYSCLTQELEARRAIARAACHAHSVMPPDERGACAPELAGLLAQIGTGSFIEARFHCSYRVNTYLGENVYLNAGCVVLDSAPVMVGDRSMLGPGVQIYCADHHREARQRAAGIERALPVTVGADVWVGGQAVILPGVAIGDAAIVAAGAVVTRTVKAGARVAGVPAKEM